jgi:tRNA pseudouridine55 synthase
MELHGFLAVDKPLGWTSHDMVAFLRKRIGVRRIGHSGTLDPSATGVLIAGVGRATRFLDNVQQSEKEYLAHVVLGADSTTADVDGEMVPRSDIGPEPDEQHVLAALTRFSGNIEQVPPKYSAIKQAGEPIYLRARKGLPVEVPPRLVTIESIDLMSYAYPDLLLLIRCSPGTYIRSIARDLGDVLGTGGYLHHLVRTRSGGVGLEECWTIEQLDEIRLRDSWTQLAMAVDLGLSGFPAIALDGSSASAWYHGRSIPTDVLHSGSGNLMRGFTIDGAFAGVATLEPIDSDRLSIKPRIVLSAG